MIASTLHTVSLEEEQSCVLMSQERQDGGSCTIEKSRGPAHVLPKQSEAVYMEGEQGSCSHTSVHCPQGAASCLFTGPSPPTWEQARRVASSLPAGAHPQRRQDTLPANKRASRGAQQSGIHLPMQEMQVRPRGREDAPEEGTATHSSILAWRIPRTEEPVHRVANNWDTAEQLTYT